MAKIGMGDIYFKKCQKTDGVVTGFTGQLKRLGYGIGSTFTPNEPEGNPLWGSDHIVETDDIGGAGGTLTTTIDRLTPEVAGALFGITPDEIKVTVGENEITGTGLAYTGSEMATPVGVAVIEKHQEDNNRNIFEVVVFREVTFQRPSNEAATMDGGTIEWQTTELTGTVMGIQGDGTLWWMRQDRLPSLAAAIQRVEDLLGGPGETTGGGTPSGG